MMSNDKNKPKKSRMHPRNRNRERYDFEALVAETPELKQYVQLNKHQMESIDFSNPQAVKQLNKALLKHYYGIENWTFPDENLCPPIPGRADYIHHLADLLSENDPIAIPRGKKVRCLDIGVGASCIYPLIGVVEYGWSFVGSDTDANSVASAQRIVSSNPPMKEHVEIRQQEESKSIFRGIIGREEKFDLTMCNPPFHASIEDAQRGTRRKIKGIAGKRVQTPVRNFAGIPGELVYVGGEYGFIRHMTEESRVFAKHCLWFSTLVSKQSNLKRIQKMLKQVETQRVRIVPMGTGNKSTRLVAWTFLSDQEQKAWKEVRWFS